MEEGRIALETGLKDLSQTSLDNGCVANFGRRVAPVERLVSSTLAAAGTTGNRRIASLNFGPNVNQI